MPLYIFFQIKSVCLDQICLQEMSLCIIAGRDLAAAVAEKESETLEASQAEVVEPSEFSFFKMFTLPSVLWQHATNTERRSANAVISGLGISIYTFGERQTPEISEDPPGPLPVSGQEDPTPTGPFQFAEVRRFALTYRCLTSTETYAAYTKKPAIDTVQAKGVLGHRSVPGRQSMAAPLSAYGNCANLYL